MRNSLLSYIFYVFLNLAVHLNPFATLLVNTAWSKLLPHGHHSLWLSRHSKSKFLEHSMAYIVKNSNKLPLQDPKAVPRIDSPSTHTVSNWSLNPIFWELFIFSSLSSQALLPDCFNVISLVLFGNVVLH